MPKKQISTPAPPPASETGQGLDMAQLARRLKAARERRGLSQTEVAARAQGLSLQNYNLLERGHARGLRAENLYRLCQVLGVTADALLGLRPDPAPAPTPLPALADVPEDALLAPYCMAAYRQGLRRGLADQVRHALALLGYEDEAQAQRAWLLERDTALTVLRQLCADLDDNAWPDDLPLATILERHVLPHLAQPAKEG